MKNKSKPDQGSYANLYKQKIAESNQNKTSILMDKEKKGINFDDLNDWVEIKYQKNDDSNLQKEYQNNNIESKQDLNIYGLLPEANSNNIYAPNKTNENKFSGLEDKEDLHLNANRNNIYQNNSKNNVYNNFGVGLNSNNNLNFDLNQQNNNINQIKNHIPDYASKNINQNYNENRPLVPNYEANFPSDQNSNYIYNDANYNINSNFNYYNKLNDNNNYDDQLIKQSNLDNLKLNHESQNNANLKSDPINNYNKNSNNNNNNNNLNNLILNTNNNQKNSNKHNALKESGMSSNNNIINYNNNLNLHNRKNSKEENFPNYPIRENDEFSINTSNFTNRWDLGNYGDKMDMSNLQNNNLAFKNQNILINYTKDNAEEFTAGNNTVENPAEITGNRPNEAYFSSSIKNQMANITNKINNLGSNKNVIYNQAANQIQPIIENESLDDDLSNNRLEDDLRNQYSEANNNLINDNNNINHLNNNNYEHAGNFNNNKNVNYKEFYNKEKINIQADNLNVNSNFNENTNLKRNLLHNNQNLHLAFNCSNNDNPDFNLNNNLNKPNQKPKTNLIKNENSEDDSDNDSSRFKNEIDNDMNITQNQLKDLKKEIYEINKQTKKQTAEADKNKPSLNKLKSLKNLTENQNITANAYNTNFTEKTKITNISTAKGDLDNNNNSISNNLNQKIKRRPSPYLRNKELINAAEKASHAAKGLRQTKSNDAKNILANNNFNNINNNDLSSKPISIQTFQQNTNIMHIDPLVNPIPQMIYNMNTFNNNYANGYGNINLAYNPMLQGHGMNLPYNSLLPPQMNYLNNVNIPNPVFGGFPAQSQAAIGNFNNIQNLNSNPNNNVTYDNASIVQESYLLNKTKGENSAVVFKPYTIKEYKEKINEVKKLEKLPRSLGANIGTKEWEEKAEKSKKAKDYAKNLAAGTANKKLYNPILNENEKEKNIDKEDIYAKNIINNNNNKNSKSTLQMKNPASKNDSEEYKAKYATEERKPMHVKDFYSNLKGIQEASDNEDSFEEFENKLERELDNPKNRNSTKKENTKVKNKTEADSLDDLEIENSPKIKKIQSGKSHIHNLINLKKISSASDKNINEIRNVNQNAVITVDFKNKSENQEKNRPKSTSKLENIKKNNVTNININNIPIKTREASLNNKNNNNKNNKNSHASADHNKIYTTLGTDRDFANRLKPLNTSRINSSLNTTRLSRPVSSKNAGKNVSIRNPNANNVNGNLNSNARKGEKENIDDLLQKHDLYYEKAQKIKNFMSKI